MSQAAPGRQRSIDLLRAVAIVLMVVVHFAENLSGWYGGAANAFAGVHRTWWLPTGFAAPIFTFLVGVSYRLRVERRRGQSDDATAKETVRRGLFLVGLGFAFNVLIWLPADVFNWDILTLIGVALVTLAVARWLPDAAILFTAIVIIAVAPALRAAAGYADFWEDGFFDYEFTIRDVTLGWLVTGYFPVFPWLAFPLAGYAVAPGLLGVSLPSGDTAAARPTAAAMLGGTALIATSAALAPLWPLLPEGVTGGSESAWSMFPATTAYVLGTLGAAMLALALAHRWLDPHPERWKAAMEWATTLSRHALSIYLLHHAVHVWPLWATGLATRGDTTGLWQVAMPVWIALGLAAVFLVAAVILFRWIDRHRLPSAEALMRWLCD